MKKLLTTIALMTRAALSGKAKNQLLMIRFLFLTFSTLLVNVSIGQHAIQEEMNHLKASGVEFLPFQVLTFESADIHNRDYKLEGLKKGVIMDLDDEVIDALLKNRNDYVQIPLPTGERDEMVLTLKRNEIFTSDFAAYASSDPDNPIDYAPGVHYKGNVDGEESSVVAISVFKEEVMGLITTDQGNFVIGRIKNDLENRHIFYNDRDLDTSFDFECGTADEGPGYTAEQLTAHPGQRDPGDCIRVYIEIDDDIVIDKGGATNALNFITSAFNQVITLYANENITMSISEAYVWVTPSPYTGTTAGQMLSSYQSNTGTFPGDLSHLISFQAMGGGVAAGFNGICNSNPDLSKCFSGIFPGFNMIPTFSWTVDVMAHEMGHLMGSRHTHACVWNFNNTAIDGCAGQTEGNCPLPGNPAGGGTIMSYCHNVQGIGTNFSLGFGPQPGNVLRNTVNTLGNCLSTSCTPTPPAYCWAEGGNQQPGNEVWIQSVDLESINNISGHDWGYGDYTGQSTTLSAGTTYTITMTAANAGINFAKAWAVWIDYNHNLDFNDTGEKVASGTGSSSVSFTFTVPASSPSVTTRMRVAMKINSSPLTVACGTIGNEVEDYTIVVEAAGGPTCTDGAQNGDETGVDCGGTTCPVCPTCTDGIENGDEEDVDCGGSCPNSCPGTVLFGHFFETGWDGWTDGGVDAERYSGSRSWEGNYSINLQDNSADQSAMTSPVVNLTGFTSVQLDFYFYSNSMENGDDFIVQYYNGSTYSTVATFVAGYGGHFSNNSFWAASVILTTSQVNFVSNAKIRIQCDAGDNNDDIYIDKVTLTGFNSTALVFAGQWVKSVERVDDHVVSIETDDNEVVLYPNPATDHIQVEYDGVINEIRLVSPQGLEILSFETDADFRELSLEQIPSGLYILMIRSGGSWTTKKFIKI